MKQLAFLMALGLCLVSCTTTDEIIIDEKRSNMTNYDVDLGDCERYAEQVAVGEKTAKGAASGGAVGGATGAVSSRHDAGESAAVGAILGGTKGLNDGEREKVQVVKTCLRGRGYKVLN